MKKFIKINFVILVIFCLSCNYLLVPINAETFDEEYSENQEELNGEENQQDEENKKQEEDEEKTLDDLQLEKADLQNIIEESNAQIQFIESDLSNTVVEIAEKKKKICDKQLEVETLQAQENEIFKYIERAENELERSDKRYEKQKELLEKRLVARLW